jgi:hypothetical protein
MNLEMLLDVQLAAVAVAIQEPFDSGWAEKLASSTLWA